MQHRKFRAKSSQWPAHPKQTAKHRVSQYQFVWVKFYKSSKFCRIWTSASSLKQTKIITNYIKNIMPNVTRHYPQIKLYSPGIKEVRTPEIYWRKLFFQEQREKLTTAHIPQTEHFSFQSMLYVHHNFGGPHGSKTNKNYDIYMLPCLQNANNFSDSEIRATNHEKSQETQSENTPT